MAGGDIIRGQIAGVHISRVVMARVDIIRSRYE